MPSEPSTPAIEPATALPTASLLGLLASLLQQHGPTAAIAGVLLWWLIFVLQANLTAIGGGISTLEKQHLEMRFYMRGICLNGADTEAKRANCIYQQDPPR